jgi:hypothetical protein
MFLNRRGAACIAVIAAAAVPVASASATSTRANDAGVGSPRCPDGYVGPTNLATGCPWWLMVSDTGAPWPWSAVLSGGH